MFEILGETGKQESLQQTFRKFEISNRLPNRYFPKIDVGCPCETRSVHTSLLRLFIRNCSNACVRALDTCKAIEASSSLLTSFP